MTALADLRVIELATHVAGPFCGKLFATFGADVIKVEPPGGDEARRMGPFRDGVRDPEASGLFLYLNTGKRGITLDARAPGGAEAFRRLLATADVVIDKTLTTLKLTTCIDLPLALIVFISAYLLRNA